MKVWHGTEVPPAVVTANGLLPVDIDRTLARLCTDRRDPRVADAVSRKEQCKWVYLSPERDVAESYAAWGSNFAGLIRNALDLPRPAQGWLYEIDLALVGEIRLPCVRPEAIVSSIAVMGA